MSRRTLASLVAAGLLLVLGAAALVLPVPYVTMSPGPTVNVLGTRGSTAIIDVSGHRTYPTKGALRLTTVSVTNPVNHIGLARALRAWADPTQAVLPRDVVYPPKQSANEAEQQSTAEMTGSQDNATAAALTELGYHPTLRPEVLSIGKGAPAAGKLKVHDQFLRVNTIRVTRPGQVAAAIQRTGVGKPATFLIRRAGHERRVMVTPVASPTDKKKAVVGVEVGVGYDFPFDVSVRLGQDIGGPSAGLMFSLGIYDTLTPGSLTGGARVAGTGTIDERGRVGPIGGIDQKIVAAADAGATVFLVPPGNCAEAAHAHVDKDKIRLVKAPTMHSAVASLRAYARDKSADLPACR
jgi:PDZ domain-containing protein